ALRVEELPPAPACRVSVAVQREPEFILLQPQGMEIRTWKYESGRIEFEIPGFDIHQMAVIKLKEE
ncbi:MAG TPA: hypothetical protein PLD05_02270, partial [Thermogutta sp.]|nr:hypothetical protein [Thermogutta sp.]